MFRNKFRSKSSLLPVKDRLTAFLSYRHRHVNRTLPLSSKKRRRRCVTPPLQPREQQMRMWLRWPWGSWLLVVDVISLVEKYVRCCWPNFFGYHPNKHRFCKISSSEHHCREFVGLFSVCPPLCLSVATNHFSSQRSESCGASHQIKAVTSNVQGSRRFLSVEAALVA